MMLIGQKTNYENPTGNERMQRSKQKKNNEKKTSPENRFIRVDAE